jgi:four helix bundle protein
VEVAREEWAARVVKLSDAAAEAAETQVWLQCAVECGYLSRQSTRALYKEFDHIIGILVRMSNQSESWVLK